MLLLFGGSISSSSSDASDSAFILRLVSALAPLDVAGVACDIAGEAGAVTLAACVVVPGGGQRTAA